MSVLYPIDQFLGNQFRNVDPKGRKQFSVVIHCLSSLQIKLNTNDTELTKNFNVV